MRRYETEEEIIKEMEAAKSKSIALQRQAEELEEEIKVALRTETYLSIDWKCASDRRKMAASLIDNRLPMLKRVLAVFRTPQFAALDNGDKSVPARA